MIDYEEKKKNRQRMKDKSDAAIVNAFFCFIGILISYFLYVVVWKLFYYALLTCILLFIYYVITSIPGV